MKTAHYEKEIAVLFERWQSLPLHKGKIFVRDGVINPQIYFANEIRPLFLLKEAYGKSEDDNDIAAEHNCNTAGSDLQKHQTWPNISRWTSVLLNPHENMDLNADEFYKKKNVFLQNIAAVNIKKSSGREKSYHNDLKKYATQDRELLREQIFLVDPTVIVCGYTLSLFFIIFPEYLDQKEFLKENHYAYVILNGHKVLLLDCYHPSCRKSDKTLYEIFKELYLKAITAE